MPLHACRAQESSVPVQTYVVLDAMSGSVLRSWRQEHTAHAARWHVRKLLSESEGTSSAAVTKLMRWVSALPPPASGPAARHLGQ